MKNQKIFFIASITIIVLVIIFIIFKITDEQCAKNTIRQLDMVFEESNFNSVDTIFINKAYFIHENRNIPFIQAFYNYQNKDFFINVI